MKLVIAGQGDVGLPLAATALRRKHEVVGYDTIPEHVVRLFGQARNNTLPEGIRGAYCNGTYKLVLGEDELPEYDAVVMTPNCMINDEPHTIWSRFEREMREVGDKLRRGNVVVLHCLSLYGWAMMQDAERMLTVASGLVAGSDYCLAWTGLTDGVYEYPESQELLVSGITPECEEQAIQLMKGITGPVRTLAELTETREIA